ncbi:hypothetical protein NC651_019656 [Populus alba x Populus x berolinensis]|nr:hypothetical protein NC651_019656 [Populus alba x Populus x berolinensis]
MYKIVIAKCTIMCPVNTNNSINHQVSCEI